MVWEERTYGAFFGVGVYDVRRDFARRRHDEGTGDERNSGVSFLRHGGQSLRAQGHDFFAVADRSFDAQLRRVHAKGHPGPVGFEDFDVRVARRRLGSESGNVRRKVEAQKTGRREQDHPENVISQNPNDQCFDIWVLEFELSLIFGLWNLSFL